MDGVGGVDRTDGLLGAGHGDGCSRDGDSSGDVMAEGATGRSSDDSERATPGEDAAGESIAARRGEEGTGQQVEWEEGEAPEETTRRLNARPQGPEARCTAQCRSAAQPQPRRSERRRNSGAECAPEQGKRGASRG